MSKAFFTGVLVGALWAALPACGPTATTLPCLKSNCAGCCDVNGECRPGTELFACGALGNRCTGCAPTDICDRGVCLPGSTGGGGGNDAGAAGGGTGGGGGGLPSDAGCGPSNCNGCCEAATGQCRAGNLFAACGSGGVVCQRCPNGQTCINFTCQTFQCHGCTDSTGACLSGTQNQACGADGGPCLICPGTQSCLRGACVTATTCGPANCNGCCDGTTCITAPTDAQCGSGGNPCQRCTSPQTCLGGTCGAAGGGGGGLGGGAGGGGSTGSCNPLNCGGCCDSQGVCQNGDQRSACGALGSPCQRCTLACLAGLCI